MTTTACGELLSRQSNTTRTRTLRVLVPPLPNGNDGACADDVQNHAFGVSAGTSYDVEVKAEIEGNGQPKLEKVIWVSLFPHTILPRADW